MLCKVSQKSDCQISPKKIAIVEHKCVLCGAKLDSKEALQEHFRKHANKEIDSRGKPPTKPVKIMKNEIPCDMCERKFDTTTAAIRHRFKMHPNSPAKFYCSYCGMQFPLKAHRDSHVATHNPVESLNTAEHEKCEECHILFYNRKALNYHYRSIHKRLVHLFQPIATLPPSNKIKINSMNDALSVYYCHLCGVEYVIKFNLQQHLEKVHSQSDRQSVPEDLIKCTMCAAMFYSKKAYDVHNSYHQPDDLYVTSEEQRLQTITKIDQDFDIRRVKPVLDKYIPKTPTKRRPLKRKKDIPKSHKTGKKLRTATSDSSSDSESDLPLEQRVKTS